jgi:low temperature requirement protein LtrA
MLERCRLFLLIALGETVFTIGSTIAAAPMNWMTLITGTCALVGSDALWALNFGHSTRLTFYYREQTSDPIRIARYAVNALTVMVAGLIAVAVANEIVISHPQGDSSFSLGLLLFGGSILHLIAQGWYLQADGKPAHWIGEKSKCVQLLCMALAMSASRLCPTPN